MRHLMEVDVHFLVHDEQVTLTIGTHNLNRYVLTVLHEQIGLDVLASDIRGAGISERIEAKNGESLIFLARRDGEIVACAVCEVATDCAAQLGYLLLPRAQCNMEILQFAVADEGGLHQVVESDDDLSAEERATARLTRLLHPGMSDQEAQELIDTVYQEEFRAEVQL